MTQVENWFLAAYCHTWPPDVEEDAWEAEWCVHKVCTKLNELSWPRVHLCRRTTKDQNFVMGKIVKWARNNTVVVETGEEDLTEAIQTPYQ